MPGSKWIVGLVLSASLLGGISVWSYNKGYSTGSENVQTKWDKERTLLLAAAMEVEQTNRQKEFAHRIETQILENKLVETEIQYEKDIANLHADYTKRLQSSNARAASYSRWAKAGTSERDHLANHTAQLDESITEGRELVKEFRYAIGQCERDLRALGEQLKIDRNLIGE